MAQHYIWVLITGGIMGFTPEEIVRFEYHFKASHLSAEHYWPMFQWYFEPEIGKIADPHGFSALHHDPVAWLRLNELRRSL